MFGSFLAIVIKGNYDVGGAGIVFDRNYQSGRIGELGPVNPRVEEEGSCLTVLLAEKWVRVRACLKSGRGGSCLMLLVAEKWVRVRACLKSGRGGSCLMLLVAEKWVRIRAVSRVGEEVVVSCSWWLRSG